MKMGPTDPATTQGLKKINVKCNLWLFSNLDEAGFTWDKKNKQLIIWVRFKVNGKGKTWRAALFL